MLYDGNLKDKTNFISGKYIEINSCNIQLSRGRAHTVVRGKGRVDYHVLYIAKGECRCLYGEHEYLLKSGDLVIYLPHEAQRYSFDEGVEVMTMWLHFSGVGVEEIFEELGLEGGILSAPSPAETEHYFRRMINAQSVVSSRYRISARGYLLNLLASLSKREGEGGAAVYSGAVVKMLEYININWQKNISVAELAERVNLSESRAAHIFKENVGESIHRYVVRLRISGAKELMGNTDMSVAEIGRMVGFSDPLYFSRVFKAATGTSPAAYIKNSRFNT